MRSLACVDVDYRARGAVAAAIAFADFGAAAPVEEVRATIASVAPYEPGKFYLRELPCLHAALARLRVSPELVIVDAYVWLDHGAPGLGARLFDDLGGAVAVIGVAKTRFRGSSHAIEVVRGGSKAPLFVTAQGLDAQVAATHILSMHGSHRIPTLLSRVDALARSTQP